MQFLCCDAIKIWINSVTFFVFIQNFYLYLITWIATCEVYTYASVFPDWLFYSEPS